ncbi:MAG: CbiX/SirB N-terminal domain-containing protein [Thermoanaerobaculia bacterium]
MRALLLVAHGSPRPEANDDIVMLAAAVRARVPGMSVLIGYLDCNAPDIATAVDECVETGATEVVVVPYFLHSGRHLVRDIPDILAGAAEKHPAVAITMSDYVGHQPAIADILLDRARAALSS